MRNFAYRLIALAAFLPSCEKAETTVEKMPVQAHGEYIYRLHDEKFPSPPPPEQKDVESYPWDKTLVANLPKLTKEYFRCKGSALNPPKTLEKSGDKHLDCGGTEKHSLPLRNGKEFIYPILIDVLNYIQLKTGKRVVITSGHRCPEHNTYVDSSPANQYSKHLMGAEVSFYVQGLEEHPEASIKLIQEYYKGQKEYEEFKRYEKPDTDVSTQPWYNKELFVKLYTRKEGRDFDNRHPYPYISLQVRYDRDLKEKVMFSWDKAHKNYYRK